MQVPGRFFRWQRASGFEGKGSLRTGLAGTRPARQRQSKLCLARFREHEVLIEFAEPFECCCYEAVCWVFRMSLDGFRQAALSPSPLLQGIIASRDDLDPFMDSQDEMLGAHSQALG